MKSIYSYFTLKLEGFAFNDIVSGNSVYYYIDCYGDRYLKESKYSLFKVKL